MKLTHCLSAVALACLPALSSAAPITYTFQVVSLVSEGGVDVDNGFTLVIESDTTLLDTSSPNFSIMPALGHSFTHRGDVGTLDNLGLYVATDIDPAIGLTFGFDDGDWLAMGSGGGLDSYDLVSNFGPYSVQNPQKISLGALVFNGVDLNYMRLDSATFTAVVDNAVPEPGSFALAGLALVGLALTRRRA